MIEVGASVKPLQAPFPWFGGKSRVAHLVWERFGNVRNYVEPFFGSGAVLLGRPQPFDGVETVNDIDGFVANFWRAVKSDPDGVADAANWPANENDLHARHAWLVGVRDELRSRIEGNPDYFDVKIAGWWVWGISCWIGGGFCSGNGPWNVVDGRLVRDAGDAGMGVQRRLIHLGNAGMGVQRKAVALQGWMRDLSQRLSRVRVASGDWLRVCGQSVTHRHGLTAVFLDPPYSHAERDPRIYRMESGSVASDVRAWAIQNGDNPKMRIAMCGYDTEHSMPESWVSVGWKAHGGYAHLGLGRGKDNASRECFWFSPHCLQPGAAQGARLFEED
jgi:DNA adenine methylase